VCIRHWDWSETSQTVSLFTREHGVVRGVAKGSKRERAPFSGGLELMDRGEVLAITKPSGAMATITAWDLRRPCPGVRRSLARWHAGLHLIDLVHHAVRDADPHPLLFDALDRALERVGGAEPGPPESVTAIVVAFQWTLLDEIGLRPELDLDVRTGRPIHQTDPVGLDPALGGVVPDPGPAASNVWRVRLGTVQYLRGIGQAGGDGVWEGVPPEQVVRAGRLLAAYLSERLGGAIPTAAGVFGG
jgi:DNA repair protein RecO (recombination protein O)